MKLCIFFSKSHIHLIFHQKWRIERGWDMKLVWSVIYTNTSTNVDTNTDFVKISHPSYFPSKIAHWEGLDHEIFLDLLLKLSDFFLKFWNLSWSFIFFSHSSYFPSKIAHWEGLDKSRFRRKVKLCLSFFSSSKSHIHLIFHQKSGIERGRSMRLVWKVSWRRVSVHGSGL